MMTIQQTLKESNWSTKYYTADAEASGKFIHSFIHRCLCIYSHSDTYWWLVWNQSIKAVTGCKWCVKVLRIWNLIHAQLPCWPKWAILPYRILICLVTKHNDHLCSSKVFYREQLLCDALNYDFKSTKTKETHSGGTKPRNKHHLNETQRWHIIAGAVHYYVVVVGREGKALNSLDESNNHTKHKY